MDNCGNQEISCQSSRAWMSYKPGDQGVTGLIVKKILSCSCKAIVYITTSGNLMWEYVGGECFEADKTVAEADKLIWVRLFCDIV